MDKPDILTIGLTGGIGSGKSAAAAAFVRLGAMLVDTDVLSRQITAPNGLAIPALTGAFGTGILLPDGSLNRPFMRQRVFADPDMPDARKTLEAILHPLIRQEAARQLAQCKAPYAVLAVPLLVETGGKSAYPIQRILLIDCPEDLQLSRVMARDQATRAEAKAILAAQASRKARREAADDILDNSGGLLQLEEAVACLHKTYLEMAKKGGNPVKKKQ